MSNSEWKISKPWQQQREVFSVCGPPLAITLSSELLVSQLESGNRDRWQFGKKKVPNLKNLNWKKCFGESLKTVVFYPDIISKWAERIPFLLWKCRHSVRRVTIVLLNKTNEEVVITRKYYIFNPLFPLFANVNDLSEILCGKKKSCHLIFCTFDYENGCKNKLTFGKLSFNDANVTIFIWQLWCRLNIAMFYIL